MSISVFWKNEKRKLKSHFIERVEKLLYDFSYYGTNYVTITLYENNNTVIARLQEGPPYRHYSVEVECSKETMVAALEEFLYKTYSDGQIDLSSESKS